jgi:hypothetical protein
MTYDLLSLIYRKFCGTCVLLLCFSVAILQCIVFCVQDFSSVFVEMNIMF